MRDHPGTKQFPVLVFVHLGENPAPTLTHMAFVASQYFPEAPVLLITDMPERWQHFPGTIIPYSTSQRSLQFKTFVKKNPELEGISGGYWLYTTERLFCLDALKLYLSPDQPVIHLESDVYSTIDKNIFDTFLSQCESGTWVPRYSTIRGIGSTLFSTSMSKLSKDLKALEELISSNPRIDNDMDLLGEALNQRIFKELPTLTEDFKHCSPEFNVLFDALAVGQYLFGQDPLHTDGIRVSGYRNPDSDFDFDNAEFTLDFAKNPLGRVAIKNGRKEFQMVTLHLHSKVTPDLVGKNLEYWKDVIKAANSGIKTYSELRIIDVIHSQKISISNRIRRARKVGYKIHSKRVIKHRLSWSYRLIQKIIGR